MSATLEVEGLTKHFRSDWLYRKTVVLEDLSFSVAEGEIFGLLGYNGAGKTTTFKLILGFLRPTSGTVRFCGAPLTPEGHTGIGFLPEQPYFYDYLNVEEALSMFARLYGLRGARRRNHIEDVIERVGLQPKRHAALRTLSKGTLQRLGIAQAILNDPKLLILDEPMSGLDPAGRRHMRELILDLRDGGTSVIFSSHILSDAEILCDRVGILRAGTLRETIDISEHNSADSYELRVSPGDAALRAEIETITGSSVVQAGPTWDIRVKTTDDVDRVVDATRRRGQSIERLVPNHTSLEERFLRHAGESQILD